MTITPEEAKNRMLYLEQEYGKGNDEEEFHKEADALFLNILAELGYEDSVEIFKRNPKWWC